MVRLPRTRPAEVGIDPISIRNWLDALERDDPRAVMVLRFGTVAVEGAWAPFQLETPYLLHSVSKSFTSSAVGMAVSEGLFGLDDPIAHYFPDRLPANPDPKLLRMTVRHCLTMTTGHATEPPNRLASADMENDWVRAFFAHPVEFEPGVHFLYNSSATYMLSALVQVTSGDTLADFLTPRLFGPLGIAQHPWQQDPRGIDTGGWGLSLKAESVAKFGQLLLQDGMWEGHRVLPEGWVAQATSKQVDNSDGQAPHDWNQGYGFQFWRCRPEAFRADGAWGQFCVVVPSLQLVVVVFSSTEDMGRLLDSVWEKLLPGVRPFAPTDMAAPSGGMPTPADVIDLDLAPRLASLASSPVASDSAAVQGVFSDEAGNSVTVTEEGVSLLIGTTHLGATTDGWTEQLVKIGNSEMLMATRAAWTGNELCVKSVDLGSPMVLVGRLTLDGDQLKGRFAFERTFGAYVLAELSLVRV